MGSSTRLSCERHAYIYILIEQAGAAAIYIVHSFDRIDGLIGSSFHLKSCPSTWVAPFSSLNKFSICEGSEATRWSRLPAKTAVVWKWGLTLWGQEEMKRSAGLMRLCIPAEWLLAVLFLREKRKQTYISWAQHLSLINNRVSVFKENNQMVKPYKRLQSQGQGHVQVAYLCSKFNDYGLLSCREHATLICLTLNEGQGQYS